MRLSADAIRGHILHPSHLHRSLALEYFAASYSADPRVMPLAIEALERYGCVEVFRDQRCLGKLVQTADSARWLLAEIQSQRPAPPRLEPYVHHLANILAHAEWKVACGLLSEITTALAGFLHAERIWRERLALATWNAEECWQAIERHAGDPPEGGANTGWPRERAFLVVEALARNGDAVVPRMMAWFGEVAYEGQRPQQTRILPLVAELARRLRHLRAIPELASHLGAEDDELSGGVAESLVSLGTDAVLRAALAVFITGDYRARVAAAGVMGRIKSELAIETILSALEHDPFGDVAGSLAQALLRQFSATANRRAREILLRYGGDTLDVERELIAVGELVGHDAAELAAWRAEFDDRRSAHRAAPHSGRVRIDPPQSIAPPGEAREEMAREGSVERRPH